MTSCSVSDKSIIARKLFKQSALSRRALFSTSIYSLRVSRQVQSMVLMQVLNSMARAAELERESESLQARSQTSIAKLNVNH